MNSDPDASVIRADDATSIISARAALKDIAFGSFAGMVSELFEYPFDLAKVRLQSQLLSPPTDPNLRFKGSIDCLVRTWKSDGFRGLYRGLPAPIVASTAETAALFLAYSSFQNIIRSYSSNPTSSDNPGKQPPLSIPQLALAAGGAGFVASFFLTPFELVKCKMQVQMMNTATSARIPPIHVPPRPSPPLRVPLPASSLVSGASPLRHPHPTTLNFISNIHSTYISPLLHPSPRHSLPGPLAIIRSIINTHGVRGLWLGHTGTLLRETGGTASWFAVKEWVAVALRDRRLAAENTSQYTSASLGSELGDVDTTLLPWESALSGAIAGGACVLAIYPADTVKSAMQTEEEIKNAMARQRNLSHTPRPPSSTPFTGGSFLQTLTRMYGIHGIRGLYAGCGMTVARAVPSSGIIFVVYDGLTAWVG